MRHFWGDARPTVPGSMDGSVSVRALAKGFRRLGPVGEAFEWNKSYVDQWCWKTQIQQLAQLVRNNQVLRDEPRIAGSLLPTVNMSLSKTASRYWSGTNHWARSTCASRPSSLIGAIWVQAALAISERKVFRPCPVCKRPIEISRSGGARTDTVFCSDRCKSRDYRQRRAECQQTCCAPFDASANRQEIGNRYCHGAPMAESRKGLVMLYKRGNVWWIKFQFAGRLFRESTKTESKTLARQAERKRHQALEEAIHGIKRRTAPVTLAAAADDWLRLKEAALAPRSYRIEVINLTRHLKPAMGSLLLIDIRPDDISD